MNSDNLPQHWALDKKVPIALIFTIVMQSMAAVWWASSMQSRMESLEAMLAGQSSTEGRLVKLEQITTMQTRTMERIESKLDRVIERGNGK